MNKRFTACLLLLAVALLNMTSCAKQTEPVSSTTVLLDTVCTVTLYDPADQDLLNQTLELCADYEQLFSRTIEGSDIYRINTAAGQPVEVDEKTIDLIEQGLYYGELSGGLFDITIGRLSSLWDFGGANYLPTQAEIDAARATVDYRQVQIEGNTVTLSDPAAMLDLGGIAKGYIADQLADFLKQNGVKQALINLGGNILTVGTKPDDQPWYIGIEQPFSNMENLVGTVGVGQASVVTSGIYERQFEQDGVLYHHILDPRTGYPAETEIAGVSIVSDTSVAGDALSTICLIMGYDAGSALLAQLEDVQGSVWVDRDGDVATAGELDFH